MVAFLAVVAIAAGVVRTHESILTDGGYIKRSHGALMMKGRNGTRVARLETMKMEAIGHDNQHTSEVRVYECPSDLSWHYEKSAEEAAWQALNPISHEAPFGEKFRDWKNSKHVRVKQEKLNYKVQHCDCDRAKANESCPRLHVDNVLRCFLFYKETPVRMLKRTLRVYCKLNDKAYQKKQLKCKQQSDWCRVREDWPGTAPLFSAARNELVRPTIKWWPS